MVNALLVFLSFFVLLFSAQSRAFEDDNTWVSGKYWHFSSYAGPTWSILLSNVSSGMGYPIRCSPDVSPACLVQYQGDDDVWRGLGYISQSSCSGSAPSQALCSQIPAPSQPDCAPDDIDQPVILKTEIKATISESGVPVLQPVPIDTVFYGECKYGVTDTHAEPEYLWYKHKTDHGITAWQKNEFIYLSHSPSEAPSTPSNVLNETDHSDDYELVEAPSDTFSEIVSDPVVEEVGTDTVTTEQTTLLEALGHVYDVINTSEYTQLIADEGSTKQTVETVTTIEHDDGSIDETIQTDVTYTKNPTETINIDNSTGDAVSNTTNATSVTNTTVVNNTYNSSGIQTSSNTSTSSSGDGGNGTGDDPESSFECEKNPDNPLCQQKSYEGEKTETSASYASCGSTLQCDSDAATCAVLQLQIDQACNTYEINQQLETLVSDHIDDVTDSLVEMETDIQGIVNGLNPDDLVPDIDPDSFSEIEFGSGSCPDPLTIEAAFLGNPQLKFEPMCSFAEDLNPLVILSAWLTGAILFIRIVTNSSPTGAAV